MKEINYKNLIVRYLNNDATEKEIQLLSVWIEEGDNEKLFEEYVKVNYLSNYGTVSFDKKRILDNYRSELEGKQPSRIYRLLHSPLKYAAIFIVLLGIGVWWLNPFTTEESLIIPNETITLELSNGELLNLQTNIDQNIKSGTGRIVSVMKGSTLYYSNSDTTSRVNYNTVHVPYGKKFQLELSDGTHVFLNAGSTFKYPEQFRSDSRMVYLQGEAFFEVKHNERSPFIVEAGKEVFVKVLGTKFNVKAYSDEEVINTVLKEGSVLVDERMHSDEQKNRSLLVPGELASFDKNARTISKEKVNVENHTAWMQGKIIFEDKSFNEALKVLERTYNVKIENKYTDLNEERYVATFNNESIDQILKIFTESRLFTYSIENNVIVINKPE
ncbi:FecR family protein [Robertkochia solimangrovi]|uniref:FecR family protein n=1 Tax=Robertkochia solimangrovi TaxID=2213046 RepID=UPI00117DFA56|nr:FecR family protein [Robertkochia solimangrovi]TRZ45185.1 hypothetical protein DMZ48_05395 [Robertkochia solimangrovi]